MTFDDTDGLTSDLGYQRYSHLFNTRSSLTEILFLFSAGKGADDGSGVVGIKTRTGGMERWDPGWWHMNIFFPFPFLVVPTCCMSVSLPSVESNQTLMFSSDPRILLGLNIFIAVTCNKWEGPE